MIGGTFLRSYRDKLLSRPILAGWLIASALLTLTGPFGTYEGFPLAQRGVYWVTAVAMSLIIGVGVEVSVNHAMPELSPWTETLVVSALFTSLFTPPLYLFTVQMAEDPSVVLSPFLAALVVFTVPFVHRALEQMVYAKTSSTSDAAPLAETPRLLRRIGQDDVNRIWHMTVRDHYVDVFTDRGKHSLLMRFTDAIDELEGIAGMRVHRSHWVATDAIRAIERESGRVFLRLSCGSTVPVSRAYQKQVAQMNLPDAALDAEPVGHE